MVIEPAHDGLDDIIRTKSVIEVGTSTSRQISGSVCCNSMRTLAISLKLSDATLPLEAHSDILADRLGQSKMEARRLWKSRSRRESMFTASAT
jgi:hypothetical protein